MKALIAAGGRGTRLRPITYLHNKHLIPVANKPMIHYALEKIAKTGITDVAINVNPGDTELSEALGDGTRWGLHITYLEQKGGALGLSHIIKNAQDWLGDDSFIFYLGDNIILSDINDFVREFEEKKLNCMLALSYVRDPQRFGVPEMNAKGEITKIEEKPERPKSNFAVTGIYIYDNSIIEAVNAIKPSARGELEISDAHTYLIDHGYKVGYKEISGWWKDTGKPYDLLEGNQLVLSDMQPKNNAALVEEGVALQGKVNIGEGTRILGHSFIRGPVVIGQNCVLRDCYIGPFTSIGDRVEVSGGEIEHSILMEDVDISTGQRIVDSILGQNVQVTAAHKTFPRGHKLVLGDNSTVEL